MGERTVFVPLTLDEMSEILAHIDDSRHRSEHEDDIVQRLEEAIAEVADA